MTENPQAKNVLEKVSSEFWKEVSIELEEGRRDSSKVVEEAGRETMEAVAKILDASNKQAESLKRQIIGSAELEVRNRQLQVLEKSVNEVFGEAIARAGKTDAQAYEKIVTRLISEGMEVIGHEAAVSCNDRDKKVVSSAIKSLGKGSANLSLGETNLDTVGGVILTSKDGAVRFNNTFEARLERLRPALRKEAANLLSG